MKKIITFLMLITAISIHQKAAAQPGACQASFSYTTDSTGSLVTFTNTSIGNYSNVQWSFGDGSGSASMNPIHQYNGFGPYIVCLTIYDSIGQCQSTFCDSIAGGGTTGCAVSFGNQGVGLSQTFYGYMLNGGNIVAYSWDFGDGTTANNQMPQHTYAAAGTYYVCLTATNSFGCTSVYCDSIVVNGGLPGCAASFIASGGGLLNLITFTNNSIGSTNYLWDFGDGSTSTQANPNHMYANPGIYTVCLTIGTPMDSCNDTYCTTITVGNVTTCNAQFGYQNVQGTFTFSSFNNPNYTHSWSFGDGTYSFSDNPVHTYGAPGAYYVCHTISDSANQCTDTFCDSIYFTSVGNCNVSFTYSVDSNGVAVFTGTSSGVMGSYIWSFGDNTTGTGANVTHQYNGSGYYTVCVSVVAQGMVLCSYCDTVVVGTPNACVPVFYAFPDSNVIGNGNVYFGIFSPCGSTQYVWSFGDGSTGNGANPVHNYADSGWYYVCVTAFTPGGTYTFCDSVYALRLGTASVMETASSIALNVFPNPAADMAAATFTLTTAGEVKATITDIQGKVLTVISEGNLSVGNHRLEINTSSLNSGVYLLNLIINGSQIHSKIVVQ